MKISKDDLRWAIDHNAGIVRATETKAQIFLGVLVLSIQFCMSLAEKFVSGAYFSLFPIIVLILLFFSLALNVVTILPAPRRILSAVGDSPFYVAKPSRLNVQAYISSVMIATDADLVRELLKVQIIREVKTIRGNFANIFTLFSLCAFAIVAGIALFFGGGAALSLPDALDQALILLSGVDRK